MHQVNLSHHSTISRRHLLQSVGGGFGMLGLADLLGAAPAEHQRPHFAPKAKRVIFLFMNAGRFNVTCSIPNLT